MSVCVKGRVGRPACVCLGCVCVHVCVCMCVRVCACVMVLLWHACMCEWARPTTLGQQHWCQSWSCTVAASKVVSTSAMMVAAVSRMCPLTRVNNALEVVMH